MSPGSSDNEQDTAAAAVNAANGGGSGSDGDTQGAAGRPLLASSTKRPLMTHSKDGKLLSEKKLRRLEKNRLSARECRRRKREATENLETQINNYEGENLRLRLQLQIGEEAEDKMRKEQEKVTEGIVDLLESGASDAEIYDNIETFKEKFADYGRDRRSGIEFHLRNIERLLMPTQTTTVVCRALQGGDQQALPAAEQQQQQQQPNDDETEQQPTKKIKLEETNAAVESVATAAAASSPAADSTATKTEAAAAAPSEGPPKTQDPKALFQYLVNILEVSPEQGAALKDSRFVAQELDSQLESSFKMLDELKERLTQCGEDLESEFDTVRNILTPTQSAKFLVWVANNGACMHMLNELWSRVYPHSDNNNGPLSDAATAEADSP